MASEEMIGGCVCGNVRYRLKRPPMIVHCCHCSWCQRETGSAFIVNALIESSEVEQLGNAPELVLTPSESGRGQLIARCPKCSVAVWSHYSMGEIVSFVRVGTLDEPATCPPDVHIFTSSKQDWVNLESETRVYEEYYTPSEVWSEESRMRLRAVRNQS